MFKLVLCLIVAVKSEFMTVVTSNGVVLGLKREGYNIFYGVPYAKVNSRNPFTNTLHHPDFKKPFVANDSSIMCPQLGDYVGGTLQCLTLNIYVPHRPENETSTLPVLVWFHGLNFEHGSANEYGGEHLVKENIIVVTVNYRLGIYGFLCTRNGAAPGNQGLKDQIEALRWIKKYIESFAGDPKRVTIAGQGYGGGMVDLHLYSEYETLFNQAIIQSGSIFATGFYANKNHNAPMKLAKILGQSIGKKTNPWDCIPKLAKTDPIHLLNLTNQLGYQMAVCKEDFITKQIKHFVMQIPFHLNKISRIRNTTILIGFNSMELLFAYMNDTPEFYSSLNDVFYTRLKNNFQFSAAVTEKLSNLTKQFYLGNKEIGPRAKEEMIKFESDFVVNHAVDRSINKYLQAGATVYKYMFSYIGNRSRRLDYLGTGYGEELKYLFEYQWRLVTKEQKLVRKNLVMMWANFVKTGNPSPTSQRNLWTPVTNSSNRYLNIDRKLEMRPYDKDFLQRMAFWDLFWYSNQKYSVLYESTLRKTGKMWKTNLYDMK